MLITQAFSAIESLPVWKYFYQYTSWFLSRR